MNLLLNLALHDQPEEKSSHIGAKKDKPVGDLIDLRMCLIDRYNLVPSLSTSETWC